MRGRILAADGSVLVGNGSTTTLTITVTGTNDAPVASAVSASGNEDTTITVTPATLETARELAALPQQIRGYGFIKDAAMEKAAVRRAELLAEFRAGGLAVMGPFEQRRRLYLTDHAHEHWTGRARVNLRRETARIARPA
mgnify:CR=1 FL=1